MNTNEGLVARIRKSLAAISSCGDETADTLSVLPASKEPAISRNVKEVMWNIRALTGIHRDFIASNLRSQMHRLASVLTCIEEEGGLDCDYTDTSLRDIESSVREIRKFLGTF